MVILGLGTNLGDREQKLHHAISLLRLPLTDMACSPVYESEALLPEDAQPGWDMPFLNMAVRGETELEPEELLAELQSIERHLGRQPRGHWGPREIDIDILAWDDREVNEKALVIPHRELLRRDFALIPLADIAPEWVHPLAKKTAGELALAMTSTLRKLEEVFS